MILNCLKQKIKICIQITLNYCKTLIINFLNIVFYIILIPLRFKCKNALLNNLLLF